MKRMTTSAHNQDGAITMIAVFLTSMLLFALVFSDHILAVQEKTMTRGEVDTEQAFFAAQSCIEEAYLQLRTNASYTGTEFTVGSSNCQVLVVPNGTDGAIVSHGVDGPIERTIVSNYTGAGGTAASTNLSAFHVLDRSGSMELKYGCTLSQYTSEQRCIENGGRWGSVPFIFVQEAAKSFVDTMNAETDMIGVVSYNDIVTFDHEQSNDFDSVKYSNTAPPRRGIDYLPHPTGQTNIGAALKRATDELVDVAPEYTRAELLITDGVPNRPFDENQGREFAREQAERAKNEGIILVTIGLGSQVDEDLLREMASLKDGEPLYFYAPNGQALEDIYNEIASALTSYNISQRSWGEQ